MPRSFQPALVSRRLSPLTCLVAGGLAFTLGILIGLMVPAHLFALNLSVHQRIHRLSRQHPSAVTNSHRRWLGPVQTTRSLTGTPSNKIEMEGEEGGPILSATIGVQGPQKVPQSAEGNIQKGQHPSAVTNTHRLWLGPVQTTRSLTGTPSNKIEMEGLILSATIGVQGSQKAPESAKGSIQKGQKRPVYFALPTTHRRSQDIGGEPRFPKPSLKEDSTALRNEAQVMDASLNDIHETRGDGVSPTDNDFDPSYGLPSTSNTNTWGRVAPRPVGYQTRAGGPVTDSAAVTSRSHGSTRAADPGVQPPGQVRRGLPVVQPMIRTSLPDAGFSVMRTKDNNISRSKEAPSTRTTTAPSTASKTTNAYATPPLSHSSMDNGTKESNKTLFKSLLSIVDGVYWTKQLEDLTPRGFSTEEIKAWRNFANSTSVLKLEEGCGRMQNRLVTFDGGQLSCCRYRQNNDQIQGEIFSFYLSELLGITNLAPAVLAHVQGPRRSQWLNVSPQLQLAQWNPERPMVLTRFVEDLVPAYIPVHFQNKQRRLFPVPADLTGLSTTTLTDLVQWSDLIVFDYLTANLDRVVNNMYNEQWNADMMRYPAHNLARIGKSGLLIFLDNESGLLHGYRLLDKYERYHLSLLDSLCVFRKKTAEAIRRLHVSPNIESLLKNSFRRNDPGMEDWLPFLPERSLKILRSRLATVFQHINKCQVRFLSSTGTTPKRIPDR